MVPGGTNYSAVDSPGGPLLGGTTYSMTEQRTEVEVYVLMEKLDVCLHLGHAVHYYLLPYLGSL